MRKGYTGLLVAVLAITAFVNPMAGPPSASQSKSAPQVGASKAKTPASKERKRPPSVLTLARPNGFCQDNSEQCTAKDLLDTIQEFFGATQEPKLLEHWNVPLDDRRGIRFVIATVPDPVHTRLPLLFDRQIDAIGEAAQEDGYLFARASMPWETKDHQEDTDYRIRLEQQDYQGLKENYPGLMLFRKVVPDVEPAQTGILPDHAKSGRAANEPGATPARQSLFVFVVGETPTGGINKAQFKEAIRVIREICSTKEDCPEYPATDRLFVLGPTFSGSLYSLKGLLQDAESDHTGFSQAVVHSGTASDFETIKWFEDSFAVAEGSPPRMIFRTFQESSKYALLHVLRLTCEEKYRPDEVAILSEDETAYGNAPRLQPPEKQADTTSCRQSGGTKCRPAPEFTGAKCVDESKVVHLYFPRNISQLRSAYQQDVAARGSSDNDTKNPSRTTLQSNLDDNGSDDDTVAPYSQIQTPLSQEAIMLGIGSSLQRHGIRFVILEATNPVDTLFLIRFLRSTSLQARIVTIETDLLLTRQLDDPLLRGSMQISSYPQIPIVDDNMAISEALPLRVHKHLVFPDNFSAGAFNALLSLLKFQDLNQPSLLACGLPDHAAQCVDLAASNYAEYGWPALAGVAPDKNADGLALNKLAPPLWLTVLGRDGYWPIAILDSVGTQSTRASVASPPRLIHAVGSLKIASNCFSLMPPQGWILICCLSVVLLIAYVLMLACGSIRSASRFLAKFAPVRDGWRNFIFFAAGGLLCLSMVAELWPWVYWGAGFRHASFAWFIAAIGLLGILLVSAELWVRGAAFLGWMLTGIGLSAFAGIFVAAGYLRAHSHPFFNLMLYRYVNISSGTSPIIPFLLLVGAALWWIWYWLTCRTFWPSEDCGYGPRLPSRAQVVDAVDESDNALIGAAAAAGVATAAVDSSGPVSRQSLDALTSDKNEVLVTLIHKSTWDFRVMFPPCMAVLLSLAIVFPHPVQSFEGKVYDCLYWFLLTVAFFGLFWALSKLIVIWLELRPLLLALDRLPLRRGFARMKGFTWRPLWGLGGSAYEDFFVNVSRELDTLARVRNSQVADQAFDREIKASGETVRKLLQWVFERQRGSGVTETEVNNDVISRLRSAYVRLRRACGAKDSIESTEELVAQLATLQSRLTAVAAEALRYLHVAWPKEVEEIEFEGRDLKGKELRKEVRKLPPATRYSEDFLCLFYFNFISSVFACMRTLVMRIAGIFVLALLSFSSYPFEPRASFHTLMIFLFVLVATVVSFVFAQMHKDATLSRITDTTPGDLGFDFWLRLAAFVSVPLFSLLATAFPAVGNFLFSWLQPATQAFR